MRNRQEKKIIVVCPNSFKGSLSAFDVANSIEKGIRLSYKNVEIRNVPIADGGDGTADVITKMLGGKKIKAKVIGPLNKIVNAEFGYVEKEKLAVIETASAAGLVLVKESLRNPLQTTTYGVGELILHALKLNPKKIIIGVGGSATVDCGIGMAQALGYKFYDKTGAEMDKYASGKDLLNINKIEYDIRLMEKFKNTKIIVASDVRNPLCGRNGAAKVFAPQKGADKKSVILLEKGLSHFAGVIEKYFPDIKKRIQGNLKLSKMDFGGAAGGLSTGLFAFCNAEIQSGARLILDTIKFNDIIENADLLITGEGAVDEQTFMGKAPSVAAEYAKAKNIPVIMITGNRINCPPIHILKEKGISGVFSIIPCPIDKFSMYKISSVQIKIMISNIINAFYN